jgi:hypothetical protein
MAQALTYMAEAAITAIVDLLLPTNDQRRAAWTLADAGGKLRAAIAARMDIDAVVWQGMQLDRDQPFAWPRIESYSCPTLIAPDPDDTGSEQVASLPRDLKYGYAIQCASAAMRLAGADPTLAMEAAAQRGVTSQGSLGGSTSVDLHQAMSPWARIDPTAAQYLRRFRVRHAEAV